MILISLLGMSAAVAFPIMMGSCAFLVLACSPQFVRRDRYNLRAAVGLTVGGPPSVLIAAFIVRSLPLFYLRWLVIAVVIYTSTMMLRAAAAELKRRGLNPRPDMVGEKSFHVFDPDGFDLQISDQNGKNGK